MVEQEAFVELTWNDPMTNCIVGGEPHVLRL